MKSKNKIFIKSIGAGISMSIPLIIGILFKEPNICTFGALGSFSFLIFRDRSIIWNIKAIVLHAIALLFSFFFGLITGMHSWILPFVISIISFIAFFFTRIYRIPKPDYFFVIMVFASGFNIRVNNIIQAFDNSIYLLYGICGALIACILTSLIMRLPKSLEKDDYESFTFLDKYYVTIHKSPDMFLKACHFSSVIFITAYISYLFRDNSGYWVLVSSAAILAGEHLNAIRKRTIGRVLGTLFGLIFGYFLIKIDMNKEVTIIFIIMFAILIEYFVSLNYTLANFFINPQVLLLMSLHEQSYKYSILSVRFAGVVIGSIIAMLLIFLMTHSIRLMDHYTIPKYYQD